MFRPQERPECVIYIHLRVSRAAFDNCVSCGKAGVPLPDLPFTGYMQTDSAMELNRLIKWLNIQWDPVGSSLRSHGPYREDFLEPSQETAAAFVYFPVHGVAAVGKCGRKGKNGGPTKAPAVNHFCICMLLGESWLITWLIVIPPICLR